METKERFINTHQFVDEMISANEQVLQETTKEENKKDAEHNLEVLYAFRRR